MEGGFSMEWNLPEGLTLDQLDEYARQRENARRRADYAAHPERALRQRLSSYSNFLRKNGRIVIARPPAPPWNDLQQKAILQALEAAMAEGGAANG